MSSIDIINRALMKLGQPPIASITQAPYGDSSGILYNDLRDMLLSSYPWTFASKSVTLAPDDGNLSGEYKYSYTLPADFLSVVKVFENWKQPNLSNMIIKSDARYRFSEGKILTDIPDKLFLVYISRQEDDTKFSSLFREALICKLAAEMSPRIKQSQSIKQQCDQEFQIIINEAKFNNAILNDIESMPDGSWIYCRGAYADGGY